MGITFSFFIKVMVDELAFGFGEQAIFSSETGKQTDVFIND